MKKKMNNKGFTLVELIVVLVILAILAAILVPALLGYIDRAKEQQIVLNAKSVLTAAQAEMSSLYGQNKKIGDTGATEANIAERIAKTSDVPKDAKFKIGTVVAPTSDDNKTKHKAYSVTYVLYTEGGNSIAYDGSAWINTKSGTVTAPAWTSSEYTVTEDANGVKSASTGSGT